MSLTIDVAPELEAYLREKAAGERRDIKTVAEALLAWAAELDSQDGRAASPGAEQWQRLERLLAGVTNDNRPQEWATGRAMGGEPW